jgi:hypothetical protein
MILRLPWLHGPGVDDFHVVTARLLELFWLELRPLSTAMIGPSPGCHWLQLGQWASMAQVLQFVPWIDNHRER